MWPDYSLVASTNTKHQIWSGATATRPGHVDIMNTTTNVCSQHLYHSHDEPAPVTFILVGVCRCSTSSVWLWPPHTRQELIHPRHAHNNTDCAPGIVRFVWLPTHFVAHQQQWQQWQKYKTKKQKNLRDGAVMHRRTVSRPSTNDKHRTLRMLSLYRLIVSIFVVDGRCFCRSRFTLKRSTWIWCTREQKNGKTSIAASQSPTRTDTSIRLMSGLCMIIIITIKKRREICWCIKSSNAKYLLSVLAHKIGNALWLQRWCMKTLAANRKKTKRLVLPRCFLIRVGGVLAQISRVHLTHQWSGLILAQENYYQWIGQMAGRKHGFILPAWDFRQHVSLAQDLYGTRLFVTKQMCPCLFDLKKKN